MAGLFSFGRKRKAEEGPGGESCRLRLKLTEEQQVAQGADAQEDDGAVAQGDKDGAAVKEDFEIHGADVRLDTDDLSVKQVEEESVLEESSEEGEVDGEVGTAVHEEFNSSMQRPQRSAEHNEDMRQSKSRRHLLNLPVTIRARIFEAAVVGRSPEPGSEREPVSIHPHSFDPFADLPLLKVSKQVRAEAEPIFFVANNFCISIRDFDAACILPWWTKAKAIRLQAKTTPISIATGSRSQETLEAGEIKLYVIYTPNWDNLKAWLRLYHSGKLFSFALCDIPAKGPRTMITKYIGIAAVFQTVRDVADEDLPWSVVEKMLGGSLTFLTRDDRRWMFEPAAEEKRVEDLEDGLDTQSEGEPPSVDESVFPGAYEDPYPDPYPWESDEHNEQRLPELSSNTNNAYSRLHAHAMITPIATKDKINVPHSPTSNMTIGQKMLATARANSAAKLAKTSQPTAVQLQFSVKPAGVESKFFSAAGGNCKIGMKRAENLALGSKIFNRHRFKGHPAPWQIRCNMPPTAPQVFGVTGKSMQMPTDKHMTEVEARTPRLPESNEDDLYGSSPVKAHKLDDFNAHGPELPSDDEDEDEDYDPDGDDDKSSSSSDFASQYSRSACSSQSRDGEQTAVPATSQQQQLHDLFSDDQDSDSGLDQNHLPPPAAATRRTRPHRLGLHPRGYSAEWAFRFTRTSEHGKRTPSVQHMPTNSTTYIQPASNSPHDGRDGEFEAFGPPDMAHDGRIFNSQRFNGLPFSNGLRRNTVSAPIGTKGLAGQPAIAEDDLYGSSPKKARSATRTRKTFQTIREEFEKTTGRPYFEAGSPHRHSEEDFGSPSDDERIALLASEDNKNSSPTKAQQPYPSSDETFGRSSQPAAKTFIDLTQGDELEEPFKEEFGTAAKAPVLVKRQCPMKETRLLPPLPPQ